MILACHDRLSEILFRNGVARSRYRCYGELPPVSIGGYLPATLHAIWRRVMRIETEQKCRCQPGIRLVLVYCFPATED